MKILIVGNGAHTKKRIFPALKKISNIQSITIGDKNADREEIIDNKTRIINLSKIFKEKKNFNIAIVATPPTSHQEIYNDISSFCEKVLIEKPISNDFDWIFGDEFKLDIKNSFSKFNFFRAACKSFIEMRSYLVTVITVTFRT